MDGDSEEPKKKSEDQTSSYSMSGLDGKGGGAKSKKKKIAKTSACCSSATVCAT
jgi:hypothetical protein